jgi:hypothetical protein
MAGVALWMRVRPCTDRRYRRTARATLRIVNWPARWRTVGTGERRADGWTSLVRRVAAARHAIDDAKSAAGPYALSDR